MSYKDAINLLSTAILSFDQEIDPALLDMLDEHSHDRIQVYRKNYFFGAFESLSSDFDCLKIHCDDNNFRYFIRDFLLKNNIRSININDLSENFISYLELSYDFHQDPLLVPLAVIDLLYNKGEFRSQTRARVPHGIFDYWCFLKKQKDSYEDIDIRNLETVVVIEDKGERYLGKLGTANEV
ncbi:MAG: putative DNA-binding domain-containing protein [Oligoflexales bacterium]